MRHTYTYIMLYVMHVVTCIYYVLDAYRCNKCNKLHCCYYNNNNNLNKNKIAFNIVIAGAAAVACKACSR